ncbi:MAG: tetratricopeptide repeat protein [Pyrinomonadaceae bacterium]|nr:tetratricopeptide repeat protein [Pyrinomonadaceae bacterium]
MVDWLRFLLMMFYAPVRAVNEVRDRAMIAPPALVALVTQAAFFYFITTLYLRGKATVLSAPWAFVSLLLQSAGILLLIAIIFAPFVIFMANVFERRGSFRVVLQQEYVAITSTLFYALAAAGVLVIPLIIVARALGLLTMLSHALIVYFEEQQKGLPPGMRALVNPETLNPQTLSLGLSFVLMLLLFGLWAVAGVRAVFRLSWAYSAGVVLIGGAVMFFSTPLLPIFGALLGSPFLLLIIFFAVRSYVGELNRTAQARANFKRNLEASTLNPADASAHYNLGLIHQQRNELGEARKRFQCAVEIDPDEVDAHYQLGRIARAEGRLADAIKDFQEVVARDETHAQYEIWREIGATYLAAGQFDDSREALSRFLAHRQSDPEGLYLIGRAFAGMGRKREAAYSMQACIEAVKTAPAYKYRTDKRWMGEAQQFLKQLQTTNDNLQATN